MFIHRQDEEFRLWANFCLDKSLLELLNLPVVQPFYRMHLVVVNDPVDVDLFCRVRDLNTLQDALENRLLVIDLVDKLLEVLLNEQTTLTDLLKDLVGVAADTVYFRHDVVDRLAEYVDR